MADSTFKRLFFGDTRFLNAYLLLAGARGLPTPLSWHRPKDSIGSEPVIDLAVTAALNQQLKGLKKPFAVNEPAPFQLANEANYDKNDNANALFEFLLPGSSCRTQIRDAQTRSARDKRGEGILPQKPLKSNAATIS